MFLGLHVQRRQEVEDRLHKLKAELQDIKGNLEERLKQEMVDDANIEAGMFVPQVWSKFYSNIEGKVEEFLDHYFAAQDQMIKNLKVDSFHATLAAESRRLKGGEES